MNRIKALRKGKGLSQEEFAKIANVHQTAVSQWETGKTNPDTSVIPLIAEHFKVTSDYILGISGNTEQKKEPTPHEELVQEFSELIKLVPPEKLPKVKNLLFPTVDAIS